MDGQTLTLAVSGVLWYGSLVMIDEETNTLWGHLRGEAEQGRLKGKRLRALPAVLTDWESWRQQHPEGTVVLLSRTSEKYGRQFYQDQDRLFVLGITRNGQAKAWGFDVLSQTPLLNEQVDDAPILVTFDRQSRTARLYERQLHDRVLVLHWQDGQLRDQETGSTWEAATGRALTGPLAGKALPLLPGVVSYKDSWRKFYPQSEMVSSP